MGIRFWVNSSFPSDLEKCSATYFWCLLFFKRNLTSFELFFHYCGGNFSVFLLLQSFLVSSFQKFDTDLLWYVFEVIPIGIYCKS